MAGNPGTTAATCISQKDYTTTEEVVMKTIIHSTLITLACSSSAFAAAGQGREEGNFLLVLFLAFLAMIIWWQLLPATKLFIDMLKGLVGEDHQEVKKHLSS
jgi:hypothetical protein